MVALVPRPSSIGGNWRAEVQLSPPQRPLPFSERGMGRGEKKARGGWGEGNSKCVGDAGKEESVPALPLFFIFCVFLPFPLQKEPLRRRELAPVVT